MKRQSKNLATELLSDSLAAQMFLKVEYKSDMTFFQELMHLIEMKDRQKLMPGVSWSSTVYAKSNDAAAASYPKVPEGVYRINQILASIEGDAHDVLNEEIHNIVLENLPPEDFTFTYLYTRGLDDTENKS